MAPYLSKYHCALNGQGYIIAQNRKGVRYYQKKRAPSFVNKFGGGDSSYRDSTFWQFFCQTNWRNGAKQLKFDDSGKFWKSSNVDTTILEELSLSKRFVSAGQLAAGIKVNCLEPWRSSTNWWDANYGYRQQITITAPSDKQVPAGYPVKVTIDTAALETAAKVRSDRKDWRIIYWNGSAWVDLVRDYVATTATFFATQAAIPATSSDSNYYAYYGYAAESTDKQPTTVAHWNEVYVPEDEDDNVKALWHFKEGSGNISDTSGNSHTGTVSGATWNTDGILGRYLSFDGTNDTIDCGNDSDFDLGSFTIEAFIKPTGLTGDQIITTKWGATASTSAYQFGTHDSAVRLNISDGIDYHDMSSGIVLSNNVACWVAVTYDGINTAKFYKNGELITTRTTGDTVNITAEKLYIGSVKATSAFWVGQISHVRISNVVRTSFPTHLGTQPTTAYGSEITTQPPASSFDLYGGGTDGKVYKWDGTTTWTEQFDCRRLTWYETGNDADELVGDEGGTEKAKSQGFQVAYGLTVKGVQVYLKKNAGTPGDITVNIETDNTNKPSGSLVHANATATIPAFTTATYGWVTAEFANTFTLSATTTYHLVLKTAAAENDQNYAWAADASSPSYTSGAQSYSVDGGSTWTADATKDQYFRILAQETDVNCMLVTSVGGTQKLYIGTGKVDGQTNGDARLYSFDGTTWALTYVFAVATSSMVNSMTEYTADSKVYFGVGPQARVYYTSDFSTFTLGKDVNIPQNPGYVYALKEYNRVLHAGGGSPEFLPSQFYNGFLNTFDTTVWNTLYPFDFTVIKSLEFYDAYLFMGTYHSHLYVYDTATLNPLFNFKDQYDYKVQIYAMKYFDDKLYMALYPQDDSNETNVGIWLFDRRGLSLAHTISGVTGYRCFTVVNGLLMVGTGDDGYVYKLDLDNYVTQGWVQLSYFDANLPSIDKLYNSVTIKHDPLRSGESIVVYYKFKESDSWTTLGTSSTVDDIEETFSFASGTDAKKITLKVELNTTDISASPKLTEVVLQYSLYSTRKWMWTMRLKAKKGLILLDKTAETRTATQIRSNLEDLLSTRQLYTFVDIDATSYNVLVNDIDQNSWVVNQDDVNEDEVIISLLEA